MSYEWRQDYDGYDFVLTVGNDAGSWLCVADTGTGEELSIDLPTDPAEVAKLVAAILNAVDCRLERLVFAEDALRGMHGMTVVKRDE